MKAYEASSLSQAKNPQPYRNLYNNAPFINPRLNATNFGLYATGNIESLIENS